MKNHKRHLQFTKNKSIDGGKKTVDLYVYENYIKVKKSGLEVKCEPFKELPTIPLLLEHMIDFILKMGYKKSFETEPVTRIYDVEITVIMQAIIKVEDESADNAEIIAKTLYENGAYILDENNIVSSEFRVIEPE